MRAHRRDPRYRLSKPVSGSLVSFQDVDIERRDEREVTALSDVPVRRGLKLRLDVIGSGRRSTLRVHVAETTPIIVDGRVRYRLRLEIVG